MTQHLRNLPALQPTVGWRVAPQPVAYPERSPLWRPAPRPLRRATAGELVWLLEHSPLYTAGTSAKPADLVAPDRFPVYAAGRGGQYTYHGPGQRVAYVMLDVRRRGGDVRAFVRDLEGWLIDTLATFGVVGERRADRVGVWVRRPERGLRHRGQDRGHRHPPPALDQLPRHQPECRARPRALFRHRSVRRPVSTASPRSPISASPRAWPRSITRSAPPSNGASVQPWPSKLYCLGAGVMPGAGFMARSCSICALIAGSTYSSCALARRSAGHLLRLAVDHRGNEAVLDGLEGRRTALAAVLELHDMPAELALDRSGYLAGLQGKGGLLEYRHHLPLAEVAEVAAVVLAAGVLRVLLGERDEVLTLADRPCSSLARSSLSTRM